MYESWTQNGTSRLRLFTMTGKIMCARQDCIADEWKQQVLNYDDWNLRIIEKEVNINQYPLERFYTPQFSFCTSAVLCNVLRQTVNMSRLASRNAYDYLLIRNNRMLQGSKTSLIVLF